jgi:hypothetical protein
VIEEEGMVRLGDSLTAKSGFWREMVMYEIIGSHCLFHPSGYTYHYAFSADARSLVHQRLRVQRVHDRIVGNESLADKRIQEPGQQFTDSFTKRGVCGCTKPDELVHKLEVIRPHRLEAAVESEGLFLHERLESPWKLVSPAFWSALT